MKNLILIFLLLFSSFTTFAFSDPDTLYVNTTKGILGITEAKINTENNTGSKSLSTNAPVLPEIIISRLPIIERHLNTWDFCRE